MAVLDPPRTDPPEAPPAHRRRWRTLAPLLATVLVLGPLAWLRVGSLVPSRYSVLQMGAADYGGGPAGFEHDHSAAAARPELAVDRLVADPSRPADVRVDLTAAAATLTVGGPE